MNNYLLKQALNQMQRNMLIGSAIGGTLGGIGGYYWSLKHRLRNTLIGAGLGGGVGGLGGYLITPNKTIKRKQNPAVEKFKKTVTKNKA